MSKSSLNMRSARAFIAFASISAVAGYAQQAATPSATETPVKLEKYVVTGSNIPTTETAGEARTFPVLTIDRRAIDTSGAFNTTELLQKMTLSNGGSVPLANNATGFTPGGTSTSLRGLGPEATLVLINGRRVASYPVGQSGVTAFVDLNTIPLDAVERIEVLKDGASATYGADAVAGVVNIIMRRNYSGATASATLGNTTDKDSSVATGSFVYGVTNEKGSITFGANYQNQQAIFQRDRSYSAVPSFKSSNASPPNLQVSRDAVLDALGLAPGSAIIINGVANTTTNVFNATTGATLSSFTLDPLPGFNKNSVNNGLLPASQYGFFTGYRSRFNFNEFAGSLPELNRRGMFASFERELSNPNLHVYGDAFFQQVLQHDELAPYATGDFKSPGTTTLVIPGRTANPILTPAEVANGNVRTAATGAFNPFNPFNQDISGGSRIRLAEWGNRVYLNQNRAYAFTGGLRVDNIADKWSLDSKIRYSVITNNTNIKLISTSRLLRALNANDEIFKPTSSSYIGTTVPYNPFGYYKNPIASNAAPVAYATANERDINMSSLADMGASLSTGDLMSMAAGDVGFAMGVDFRREFIDQQPDSALQAGDILTASPASPITRARQVASYFAEAEIPLFSDKHSVDFAHRLSLNLAGRYETFLTSKQHVFVPKVGVKWSPLADDTLIVRASWGKGFRQPSLYEIYAPPIAALTPIFDPVANRNEPEQSITTAGNRNLSAEKTKSFNVGAVWTPKGSSLDGFTFSIDAWKIERDGTVAVDHQDVLNRSLVGGLGLQPGESVIRDFSGHLVQVNAVYSNRGITKVQGIDLASSYLWKTDSFGRFDVGLNATYMDSYKQSSIPGAPLLELIDATIPGTGGDDAYLQWKAQAYVSWTYKGLNTHLNATYTDGFADLDEDSNPRRASSTIQYDLQFSYSLFPSKGKEATAWYSDLKVTAGCNNVLDTNPPIVFDEGNNSNGYPGFLYSNLGRFFYVGLEKKL